jgi:cysteine synthase
VTKSARQLDRETLAPFWTSEERRDRLRDGFRALCLFLDLQPPWIARQVRSHFPGLTGVKDVTLRRYHHANGRAHLKGPLQLSALLATCEDVLRASGKETDAEPSLAPLLLLAQEFRECHGSLLEAVVEVAPAALREVADSTARFSPDQLRNVIHHIYQPSEITTLHPEFPPGSPRWPATPCLRREFAGHDFLIKDESQNPSGTHKDRWAWEKVVQYKQIIERALEAGDDRIKLPAYSMISSGSAALALQCMLRIHQLPDLHVGVDGQRVKQRIIDKLRAHGAEVHRLDLKEEILTEEQVCMETQNHGGHDVTPRHARASFEEHHYDWMVYEILEEKPKHIFVPFGSGGLFASIMYIIEAEKSGRRDDRLREGSASIENVNLYGATSDDPKTNMEMLFAYHRPMLGGIEQDLERFVADKVLGSRSAICDVGNNDAVRAVEWAQGARIRTDYSGAAGLALFMKMAGDIPPDELVLVVNTGAIALPPP